LAAVATATATAMAIATNTHNVSWRDARALRSINVRGRRRRMTIVIRSALRNRDRTAIWVYMSAEKEISPYFHISSAKMVSQKLYDPQLDLKIFLKKNNSLDLTFHLLFLKNNFKSDPHTKIMNRPLSYQF